MDKCKMDPDNLWYVCKFCRRAFKEKGPLLVHKTQNHKNLLKEEKRSKRLKKKLVNGHAVSLGKSLVDVDVPLIKAAAVKDIQEVQLPQQRHESQVFAVETMDHDGIEDNMNEGEQRLQSLEPGPAMVDQSNVNESLFHSAQPVNVTDNGNDVDHSSVKLTTVKRRRRGRSSKNKRLIKNTSKPQETFLEKTGICEAEVISINLGNGIPNPIDTNNIGAKSLNSDKQETDTTVETSLNLFNGGIHSLVSSDNIISESLGAIEICKRGVLVQTEKLDSRTSIVEEDSLELHETSSCSNSTFSYKNRYNTRIKVERISYTENQLCKKCNILVAADELVEHSKNCTLYKCKHCRLETTDLAIFEDHKIKTHALGPKEKSCLLNAAFKTHLKREKKLDEEKTTKDTKKDKSRKEKVAKIQEEKLKKKIKQSSTASLTKIERLKCTVCDRKFRSIAVLNKHISTVHTSPRKIQPTPPSKTLRDLKLNSSVGLCMIEAKTMKIEQIQSGNQEEHAQNVKVQGYVCNICNETFPTVKSGRIHGETYHREDCPFYCRSKYCVSRFKSQQSLIAHKRVEHRPQRLQKHFQLKIKVKSTNNNVNNNSSENPTKKKFKCDSCGREFVRGAWFKNHVRLQCVQNNNKDVSATDVKPPTSLELSQPSVTTHNKVTDNELVSRFGGQPHFTESELKSHEDEDIHRFNSMNTQTEVVNNYGR